MYNILIESFIYYLYHNQYKDPNDSIISGSLPVHSSIDSYMALNKHESRSKNSSNENSDENILLSRLNQIKNRKTSSKELSNQCIVSATTANKKIVRFADTFGLDLENVRIITNNSFMGAFASSTQDLDQFEPDGNENASKGDGTATTTFNAVSVPFLVLIPLFSIRKPLIPDFVLKLNEYLFDYENQIIKCIVKVKNLSFKKRVFARVTFNNWKSNFDMDAMYLRADEMAPNSYDFFGFCIIIPDKSTLVSSSSVFGGKQSASPFDDCICRIEFALCCEQNGVSYWDSNGGENYKFQCFFNISN